MQKIAIGLLAAILLLSLTSRAFADEQADLAYSQDVNSDVRHEVCTTLDGTATCGHANVETRNVKDATCTEEGCTGDVYCTDCGELVTGGSAIPATGAHKFSDWISNEELSCRVCIVCSFEEVEYYEPLPVYTPNWAVIGIAAAAVVVIVGGVTAIVVIKKKKN